MRGLSKVVVLLIILGFGYFGSQNGLKIPGFDSKPSYSPVKTDQKIPKQIFGLTNVGDGKWENSSGEVVYEQARVYAGSSKSQPLKPVEEDGCTYNKDKKATVVVDSNKYPASALHILIAIHNGVPQTLHVNRDPGYDLRANSLEGIPSNSTTDRDEYPFALSNEAVVYNKKVGTSDIAFIPFGDNRGSGSSMGNQLSDYCTGQAFQIVLDPAK